MKDVVPVFFAKMKPGAVIPSKRDEDAGYDLYACLDENAVVHIPPHTTVSVSTGIASSCPVGYYFQTQERGSVGIRGLAKRCGVIDSGYRGEWFLPFSNVTDDEMYIAGAKMAESLKEEWEKTMPHSNKLCIFPAEKAVAQAILLELPRAVVTECSYEALCEIKSERGTGAKGSTNK